MEIVLRTNEDDWRELYVVSGEHPGHSGHDIPEYVWIELLKAAGVEVEEVFDDFGQAEWTT